MEQSMTSVGGPRTGRILYFTDDRAPSTQRDLELARRLQERGHEVLVTGPADLTADAERSGVRFRHLPGSDSRLAAISADSWTARTDRHPTALLRRLRTGWTLRQDSLAAREIEEVITDHDPDLVLAELEYHTAVIAAIAAGRKVATVTGYHSIFPSSTNPPLDTSLRPGVDSREAISAAWTESLAENARLRRRSRWSKKRVLAPFQPVSAMTNDVADLAAFARRRKLRLSDHVDTDCWLRPFIITNVDTFSLNPGIFEFAEPTPHWHTVGAVLPEGGGLDRGSDEDRAALAALRERRRSASGRPLVYATVGTFWADPLAMLRLIVDALGECAEVDAVVGLGSLVTAAELGPVADNVVAVSWAPQLDLLTEAALAVTHGGTSLVEAAAAGVPVVCASTRTNDQNSNVARAVHAGLATEFDSRTISPVELAALIRSTLADDGRRARAREIADSIAAETAEGLAVAAIERCAGLRT